MRRYQGGMSILGWLAVVLAIGGSAMLVVRLAPHYIDFETLVTVVEALSPIRAD
ncbi:MAG: hypothetical protein HC809_15225 [Gammaproteobacteria bacterium]|nr:hypothetical protein [Gammaproteobacteria bacterium]